MHDNNMYMEVLPDPLEGSTSTTGYPSLSLEQMTEMMVFATDRLEEMRRRSVLKIWRGPHFLDFIREKPLLRVSGMIAGNTIYIMAGVGIVAGRDMYNMLNSFTMMLEWSDDYIPLEDQESELAKILLKLKVKQSD